MDCRDKPGNDKLGKHHTGFTGMTSESASYRFDVRSFTEL
jgi:hypothetical protein